MQLHRQIDQEINLAAKQFPSLPFPPPQKRISRTIQLIWFTTWHPKASSSTRHTEQMHGWGNTGRQDSICHGCVRGEVNEQTHLQLTLPRLGCFNDTHMNTQGSLFPLSFQAFQLSPLEIPTTSGSDNHIWNTSLQQLPTWACPLCQATAAHQATATELQWPNAASPVTAWRHTWS